MTSASSFLEQIKQEWKTNVQPIIEDVYESITQIIEKKTMDSNLFRTCEPIDLYTQIYNMTIHHQFDFCHLDFLYHQEIHAIVVFCKKFRIHTLSEMKRQIFGFKILLKWFHVFFHHLNRFRQRSYHTTCTIEEEMITTIRNHYMKAQIPIISQLVSSKWSKIRKNQYMSDSTLDDIMNIIFSFHSQYYNDLLSLYLIHLQDFLQKKSTLWLSHDNILFYMTNVNQCFCHEEKMFLEYFREESEELPHIHIILKKTFIYPYCDIFLQDDQYGWKALLRANCLTDIQTAYKYFSWMEDPSLWSFLYQEFLEERIAAFPCETFISSMAHLLKEQNRLLIDVFRDEKLKVYFTTTMEKTIQKAMGRDDHLIFQLAKTLHHQVSKRSSKQVLKDISSLVAFCPEKDLFYQHYHHFLKIRLMLGRYFIPHEKMLLDMFRTKLGMSFVLNLHLMMEEIQNNRFSIKHYSLHKLSRVVWKLETQKSLQYKIPETVQKYLGILFDKMQKEKINKDIRLELLWYQGTVILTRNGTDFYMNPIQAIVLLTLDHEPITRQTLITRLQIVDDTHHNLGGVLESLSKAMLIIEKEPNQWCWYAHGNQTHRITRVMVPLVKKPLTQIESEKQENKVCPIVIEAFIVKTLKHEKSMPFFQVLEVVHKRYSVRLVEVKRIIESLMDREFLSKDNDNHLHYVP